MATATFTATARNGETSTRSSGTMHYTHATITPDGGVIRWHISPEAAYKFAASGGRTAPPVGSYVEPVHITKVSGKPEPGSWIAEAATRLVVEAEQATKAAPAKAKAKAAKAAVAPAPAVETLARMPKSFQVSGKVAAYLTAHGTEFAEKLVTTRADGWPTVRLSADDLARFTAEVENMAEDENPKHQDAAQRVLRRIARVAPAA